MVEEENSTLLRVAGAVADGARINWQVELEGDPGGQAALRELRLLADLANAHLAAHAAVSEKLRESSAPAADPLEPAPLSFTWGPLRILERIGLGGFSEVYRAFDPALQREVALKLHRRMSKDEDGAAAQRFLREARLLARIRHPNVLLVHGADEHEGRVGLWTDLLRGRTLEQMLLADGMFSASEAALTGIDLCAALAAVHAGGLLHRDIKTANVMREQGGRIVLMDFGSVGRRPGAAASAGEDLSTGTPLYLPPELILGAAEPAPTADIYALGVVLHRLVSGGYPVEADLLPVLIDKHRRRESVSLRDVRPELPEGFVQIVARALDPDPARRYPTPGAMARDLRAVIGAGAAPVS